MGYDADGNYTETEYTYSNPVKSSGVITVANGEAETQLFGANERYDKVITLNAGENYLVVGSVLWVDTTPVIEQDGSTKTPFDYTVRKVSKSLSGFIVVAIQKVNVE
jgi:hypothetical protein